MLKTVATCLCALAGAAALVLTAAKVLDRPEVHVSWTTDKCVRVVDPNAEAEGRKSEWSCGRLPRSYEHVWVR